MMKVKVEREIDRICRYEKKWKIKTSGEKFRIIHLAQYKTKQFKVNGKNIDTRKDGKLLGLKLQATGLAGHVNEKVKKKERGYALN